MSITAFRTVSGMHRDEMKMLDGLDCCSVFHSQLTVSTEEKLSKLHLDLPDTTNTDKSLAFFSMVQERLHPNDGRGSESVHFIRHGSGSCINIWN